MNTQKALEIALNWATSVPTGYDNQIVAMALLETQAEVVRLREALEEMTRKFNRECFGHKFNEHTLKSFLEAAPNTRALFATTLAKEGA